MLNLQIFQNRPAFLLIPILLSVGLFIAACTDVVPASPAATRAVEEPAPSPVVLSSDDNLVLVPITAVDMADTSEDVFLLLPASRLPEEQLPEDLAASATTSTAVLVPFAIVDNPPDDILALVSEDKVQREVEGRPVFIGDLQPRSPITLTSDVKLFVTIEDLGRTASDDNAVVPHNLEVPTELSTPTLSITSSALSLFTSSDVLVTGYDPAIFPKENLVDGFTLQLPGPGDTCPTCTCADVCRLTGCCSWYCCLGSEFPGELPDLEEELPDIELKSQ
jgi:hypothetical protein